MTIKRILFYLCLIAGIFCTNISQSQTVRAQNLSSVRVDELTDAQIRQFLAQVGASGLTDTQLEQRALSLGMKPVEIRKLKDRVNKLKNGDQNNQSKKVTGSKGFNNLSDTLKVVSDSLSQADKALAELRSKIFGTDLFSNPRPSFEPNLRIATPINYQVGPDDELLIDIYGYSEASYQLTVSPEGTINIPYVGVIPVGGMTIEQATTRIRTQLSSIYSGLKTGNTNVRVSLGNIRSIKVVLTGELVRPGTYTLPSVGSVFNALYQSGGPTENGSFRQIEVIRGGRKIATMDIYDFLLTGEFKNNIRLQDQDVIRVPTYRKRVEIVGEVKRPGIFEMLHGESFADLLRFSGDFTERAYQARIKVLKNTATERKISDITASEFAAYQPSTGDKFFVDEILDRFANRVTIEGAVFRPGQFELEPGMTIKQLLQKAEGLKEDAFLNRAYITRLGKNLQTQLISVDLNAILTNRSEDILLQREDILSISSVFDLKEEYHIRVDGEVRKPGILHFAEGMTIEDAIIQAGGFKEGATSQRIEVSRRVKNSNALSTSAQTAEVFQINIDQDLKSATTGFVLQPFDIIAIRPSEGYEKQRQVRVQGEVLYPGVYTLTRKDERISDIIKRAGGFTAWAYSEGASLRRPGPQKDRVDLKAVQVMRANSEGVFDVLKNNSQDSTNLKWMDSKLDNLKPNSEVGRNEYVGINLPGILNRPGSREDLFLEEGDVLYIPKQLQTVKVTGEVLSPVTITYSRSKGFRQYIANAGGFSEKAVRKRSYIKYANGAVKSTKSYVLFNSYPSVKPGAEIIVPIGAPKKPFSVSEIVGLSTSIVTLLLLFNQISK